MNYFYIINSKNKAIMSANGVRKCNQSEKNFLNEVWRQIQPHMKSEGEQYSNVLSWCNIYQNRNFKVDFPLMKEWLEWLNKLVDEVYPGCQILCSGFLKNPPHSKKNQIWHTDYGKSVHNLMIPMVDQGCQTATQFIQYPMKQRGQISPLGYDSHYGYNILDVMDREGLDFLKVSQIVCRSHTILKLDANTVHRGIANGSDEERIVFYINVSSQYFELNDEPFVVTNMATPNKQE